MKYIALIVTICCLASTSSSFAEPKAKETKTTKTAKTAPVVQPKISKKDAEHAVLFKYKGGSIEKCELSKGNPPNWIVDVLQVGAHNSIQVMVDGQTGKVSTADAVPAGSVAPAKKTSGMSNY